MQGEKEENFFRIPGLIFQDCIKLSEWESSQLLKLNQNKIFPMEWDLGNYSLSYLILYIQWLL